MLNFYFAVEKIVILEHIYQTNIEIMKEEDFTRILELEEEFVQKTCEDIIRVKPDVVFTEKGVSDLAQHYLVKVFIYTCLINFIYIILFITHISGKAGITAIRRVRKSDNNRIARASGATIVNRTDEIREEDIGTQAGLFEIKKVTCRIYKQFRFTIVNNICCYLTDRRRVLLLCG